MAARNTTSGSLVLAACGKRKDVLHPTSHSEVHLSNGVYWYCVPNVSFGFSAHPNVQLGYVDTSDEEGHHRLSWQLSTSAGHARAGGYKTWEGGSRGHEYEKVILVHQGRALSGAEGQLFPGRQVKTKDELKDSNLDAFLHDRRSVIVSGQDLEMATVVAKASQPAKWLVCANIDGAPASCYINGDQLEAQGLDFPANVSLEHSHLSSMTQTLSTKFPMQAIRSLSLAKNVLQDLPKDFASVFPELRMLDLSANAFAKLPAALASCAWLEEVLMLQNPSLDEKTWLCGVESFAHSPPSNLRAVRVDFASVSPLTKKLVLTLAKRNVERCESMCIALNQQGLGDSELKELAPLLLEACKRRRWRGRSCMLFLTGERDGKDCCCRFMDASGQKLLFRLEQASGQLLLLVSDGDDEWQADEPVKEIEWDSSSRAMRVCTSGGGTSIYQLKELRTPESLHQLWNLAEIASSPAVKLIGLQLEDGALKVASATRTPFLDLRYNHITEFPSDLEQSIAAFGGSVLMSPHQATSVGIPGSVMAVTKQLDGVGASFDAVGKQAMEEDCSVVQHLLTKEEGHVFRFCGQLKEGVEHSSGTRIYADGWALEATWVDGKRQGPATAQRRDGTSTTPSNVVSVCEPASAAIAHERCVPPPPAVVKETWKVEYKDDDIHGLAVGHLADESRYEGTIKEIVCPPGLRDGPRVGAFGQTAAAGGFGAYGALHTSGFGGGFGGGMLGGFGAPWTASAVGGGKSEKVDEDKEVQLSSMSFVPSGEGVMIYADGSQYAGSFKEGKFAGEGLYQWPRDVANTPHYVGAFVDGRMHGAGVLKWSNGQQFSGTFARGCPEKGVLERPGESTKVGASPCCLP